MLNFALALLSAILLIVIQPALSLTLFAPFALSPLLFALSREVRWKRAFQLGYAAGFVYWFGVCYWIQFVLEVHGAMGFWGGWGAFLLFCLAKGLHLGVFAVGAHRLLKTPLSVLTIPALWCALERTHSTFGFMWLHLGNAAIDNGLFLPLAPFTGVYGLSFLLALVSTAVAVRLIQRRALGVILLALIVFGSLLPPFDQRVAGKQQAAVAQPNLDTEAEWTAAGVNQFETELTALTRQSALDPAAGPPAIMLWPEVPAPVYYDADPRFHEAASALARVAHAPFLFGTVTHAEGMRILNSAQLLTETGAASERYDKINLVPFGEFIPPMFGFVNRITNEIGDFSPGERIVVFPLGTHLAATFICYESAFPHEVRKFVAGGAEVLFNLSNDGYFGHTAARAQHLFLVRMRAVENKRWIIRATNDGITASIDPAGRVTGQFPPYRRVAGRLAFDFIQAETVYSRFGDWFVALCAIAAIAGLVASVRGVRLRPDARRL